MNVSFRHLNMKEEIIDDEYEEATIPHARKRPSAAETEESLLVAKRIKQELGIDDDEPQEIIVRRIVRDIPPPPIVFDHFICMRIGLNSENNVQKLMAVLVCFKCDELVTVCVIPECSQFCGLNRHPGPVYSSTSLGSTT